MNLTARVARRWPGATPRSPGPAQQNKQYKHTKQKHVTACRPLSYLRLRRFRSRVRTNLKLAGGPQRHYEYYHYHHHYY